LELLFLGPTDPEIRLTEFDVGPVDKYGFQPPPEFHHQRQVHVNAAPGQDVVSLLLPHRPDQPVALVPDPETAGARVEIGPQVDRVMLFPQRRSIQAKTLVYEGTAGIVRVRGTEVTLIQVTGSRIGIPGLLTVEGDGPFTAALTSNGHLTIHTDGVARWLTVSPPLAEAATCNDTPIAVERPTAQALRVQVPAGRNTITIAT